MHRTAVVGLGIGLAHCAGYLESKNAQLAAVCDLDPVCLSKVGGTFSQGSMLILKQLFSEGILKKTWEELGVKTYQYIDDLLEDDTIDTISLCIPDYQHAEQALKIIKKGKNLLLEKPIAITSEDAERVLEENDKQTGRLAIGYEFRINPAIRKIKDLIDGGFTGKIHAFSLYHFRKSFKHDKWNRWIEKKKYSGGLLVEETCHWFDLARHITGKEIESLHCVTTDKIYKDFDYEDIAYINGRFADGAILQISHALTGFDFDLSITVYGEKGTIRCSLKESPANYYGIVSWGKPDGSPEKAETAAFGIEASEPYNIKEYVKYFINTLSDTPYSEVLNVNGILASADDGFKSLKLSLLSQKSAEEEKIIKGIS
ncbi:MAG: Gfo/Idh/MocA family oxidoreductase [Spirochaetales bacterium]|nr:Gfo/Idh/MocA family oxidoreductase [Spirochaetales bacterium]